MKGKIILWLAATLLLIGWEYYHHRDIRKTLLASGTFVWIASMATIGITMRPILPLFAAHYLLILLSWGALIYYLLRGKYLWWVFLLPVVTVLAFLGLNFLEGSRYERN